jgi:hypothetical protein
MHRALQLLLFRGAVAGYLELGLHLLYTHWGSAISIVHYGLWALALALRRFSILRKAPGYLPVYENRDAR